MQRCALLLFLLWSFTGASFCFAVEAGAEQTAQSSQAGQTDQSSQDAGNEKGSAAQEAWDSLVLHYLQVLGKINKEADALRAGLSKRTADFNAKINEYQAEFQRLAAISRVSQNLPAQRTVVVERVRRLQESVSSLIVMGERSINSLTEQLQELSSLKEEASLTETPGIRELRTQLENTQAKVRVVQSSYSRALAPARRLSTEMDHLQGLLDTEMAKQWSDYYLTPLGQFFESANWQSIAGQQVLQQSFADIFALRMTTELPQGFLEWMAVLWRLFFFIVPVGLLLGYSRYTVRAAESLLDKGWRRMSVSSMPWLALGLSLYYASWAEGNMYQLLASCGTMVLCWGQIKLAWDFACFEQPEDTEHSPLLPLFPPLLVGLVLLYIDPSPMLLSLVWLLAQGYTQWRLGKVLAFGNMGKVSRTLLHSARILGWVGMAITLMGWGRLSILVLMCCVALLVCIQQTFALLRLGSVMEENAPKEGAPALAARVLIALALPAVLLVVTIIPMLWVLAYPGGAYLLRAVAKLGFSVGAVSFNAMQVLSIFIAFYLTRALISVGKTFLSSVRSQGWRMDPTLTGPLQTGYTYVLWAIFALYVLSSLGFSLTSLTVIAGGLSVGLGFGMQNIVQNFFSGLMVIFGQIIREGDVLEVGAITGVVRKVNIRSTQIQTYDNATIFVPNSQFLSSTFTNWTHNGRMVRREVNVGVAYGTDAERAMRLLLEAAQSIPQVLHYPAPFVQFVEFGPSSLNLRLRFWVSEIEDAAGVLTRVHLKVDESFRENQVEISFPQLDVHMRTE